MRVARRARSQPRWTPRAIEGAPDLDPLDRLIGRAVVDARFRALLLADPLAALRIEQMPLRLKRALVTIRARSLGDFAVRALDIQAAMQAAERSGRAARPPAGDGSPARRVFAGGPGWPRVRRTAEVASFVARDRADAARSAPTPALVRPLP